MRNRDWGGKLWKNCDYRNCKEDDGDGVSDEYCWSMNKKQTAV